MKSIKQHARQLFLIAAIAVLPCAQAAAQSNMDPKPAAVISVASIEEQADDVRHLMAAAGLEIFGEMAVNMSREFTQYFQSDLPIGGYVTLDYGQPQFVGFIPVEDLGEALDTFEAELGDIEELDDGMLLITLPDGQEAFVLESDGFAFFSNVEENLFELPSDPADLLAGLEDEYNLAVRLYAQNIPNQLKQQIIGFIEEGFNEAMGQIEQVDPDAAQFQREMSEISIMSMVEMIEQTDEVTVGLAIDEDTQSTYLDFSITAVEGSSLAEQVAQSEAVETNFAGFLHPEAAVSFHVASKMADEDVEMIDEMFDGMREQFLAQIEDEAGLSAQEQEVAERVFGGFMDVFSATMKGGVIDGGASVVLNEDTVAVASGMTVAEGDTLEDTLKELVAIAQSEGAENVEFNMDADTYNGVNMHLIDIEVPPFEEDVRNLFGDSVTLVVGTADDAFYFAAGKGSMSLLKECIDSSENSQAADLPNSQFNVYVARVLDFAAMVEPNEVTVILADAIAGSEHDRFSITSTMIENGARTRIEFQDDIVKLLGVAGMQFGGGFGPGF